MPKAVGVRFRRVGKVYHFDPGSLEPTPGTKVVVETSRGLELGEITGRVQDLPGEAINAPLKPVIRLAAADDLRRREENQRREEEAREIWREKTAARSLEMNLVDVEYTFDRSRIVFYFTAEGRVDFRELVRDLAGVFRTRVELRQVGVRDEAKMLGGLGPCGRVICCHSFLSDFAPVSIRMAKGQNLALNPSKISGICGRLICCLRYEFDEPDERRATAARQEECPRTTSTSFAAATGASTRAIPPTSNGDSGSTEEDKGPDTPGGEDR